MELGRVCGMPAAAGNPSDDHRAGTCTKGQIVQVPDVISHKKMF